MTIRSHSIQSLSKSKIGDSQDSAPMLKPVSEYFNENVFGPEVKKKYLPSDILNKLNRCIDDYKPIDIETANIIAFGLKNWAIDNDVTHYTHWFQPLNGKTSEKHDTFFQFDKEWRAVEKFSGAELIAQEPDGSSFPTGGLRSTHEARSYTLWDPTSPIFIRKTKFANTLCIPAILISYNGESLDMKAPLLKSMRLINNAAVNVCKLFDENISKVTPTLGWEQEYFVVDEALYNARPDLVLSGRTLFGNASARNQQLADHYFGAIPERVYNFIIDFEREALKLGIPIKTRHNEVAPNQFECAPHFEFANIAADHNLLLMDKIDRVAKRHGLRVLVHEKPFQGINGSGKHNNWSLATNTGLNLLEPGDDPSNNLLFLTFFINIIKAIADHGDLLRASIATSGNEHRLGANEAPPAIISVFTGDNMEHILNDFKECRIAQNITEEISENLDYLLIPYKKLHSTDRNRTSPFPFTGNKFEFRAVGSSVNVSVPMTVLNVIVADQLKIFKTKVDELINNGTDKFKAIETVLRQDLTAGEHIIFNGDNYADEWLDEAVRRGLPNIKSTPEALKSYLSEKNVNLFLRNSIFSERELQARFNVAIEEYIQKLEIEALLVDEIANTMIIPAVVNYQNEIIKNVQGLKDLGMINESEAHKNQLIRISNHLEGMIKNLDKLDDERHNAEQIKDLYEKAIYYNVKIKPLYDAVRIHADKLELMVDDKFWQLPKYRELLFLQ
jgi:glutamine synthetase